ncbi:MAG: hypothetical protein C0591_01115 [Marinilabiliales bacterium]|nr:MAG: hypothetical protein C0591_01115 [Marinilabiliales bacterium]
MPEVHNSNPLGFGISPFYLVPIERVTNGVPIIDTNHAQIHAGNAFSFAKHQSLAAGASLDVTFEVPAGAYVHFQAFDVVSDGLNELTVKLYEGTTLNATPGGTAITPVNRHRVGTPESSVLTVKHGATIDADGTELDEMFLPKVSSGAVKNMATKGDSIEWILKPEEVYLLRLENTGTTTALVAVVRPFWYEEGGA